MLDGIQRGTQHARPSRPISPPARSRQSLNRVGSGLMLLGMIGVIGGLIALRPSVSADSQSLISSAIPGAGLPKTHQPDAIFRAPQGGGTNIPLENLVVLDQPTETSKPQPDRLSDQLTINDQTASKHPDEMTSTDQPLKTAFTVRILNGGGKAGAAAQLRDELKTNGFTVISIGNAQSTFAKTTIVYGTGKRSEAELVATILGSPALTLAQDISPAPADVLVVLGHDHS
ncbi:LytR C-terminal domain-containing protein [Candidatus Berkelbacteria bacterium]|nr:LytR C-terminal domain-containing protein [Candidatus Berkelbacteria bacterium]